MRGSRAAVEDGSDEDEAEASGLERAGSFTALQRLEDSVGLLSGELGVCVRDARYLTCWITRENVT